MTGGGQADGGIDGFVEAARFLGGDAAKLELAQFVGRRVLEKVKDHLDEMSATRHKTADRLGAQHSKFLEYASGRTVGGRKGQGTFLRDVSEAGATVSIENTPGLDRAYHDLHIKPVRAGALTIPISRYAYNKRVKELRDEGYEIARPKGKNILMGKKGKKGKARPMFALVKSVTVPKDPGLLPQNAEVGEWVADSIQDFIDVKLGGF